VRVGAAWLAGDKLKGWLTNSCDEWGTAIQLCVAGAAGGSPTESKMSENLYEVRWILNHDDPERPGFYGTTKHLGISPAAAAIASARSVSNSADESWGRAQLHILRVSGVLDDENLLCAQDLQAALRLFDAGLPIEVVYRPLC